MNTGNIVPLTTNQTGCLTQTGWWDNFGVWHAAPSTYYIETVTPPVECSAGVHVFPCPHCDKCKCGAATVKREKVKK